MDEHPTCGRGLAEHSAVPARLGLLIECLGDNLELHLPTIDTRTEAGMAEHGAYATLVEECREIGRELTSMSERMAAYRDLPMAPHHRDALADPTILHAFERYVAVQDQLVELLLGARERDRQMLRAMRNGQ